MKKGHQWLNICLRQYFWDPAYRAFRSLFQMAEHAYACTISSMFIDSLFAFTDGPNKTNALTHFMLVHIFNTIKRNNDTHLCPGPTGLQAAARCHLSCHPPSFCHAAQPPQQRQSGPWTLQLGWRSPSSHPPLWGCTASVYMCVLVAHRDELWRRVLT
jgi:hypothetical protein